MLSHTFKWMKFNSYVDKVPNQFQVQEFHDFVLCSASIIIFASYYAVESILSSVQITGFNLIHCSDHGMELCP